MYIYYFDGFVNVLKTKLGTVYGNIVGIKFEAVQSSPGLLVVHIFINPLVKRLSVNVSCCFFNVHI